MLALADNLDVAALEENAERAAALLRSVGSKWRLLVLCQLVKGEKSVGQLESIIGLSQSALSQHLTVLRHNGLVKTRRCAQMIFYSLNGHEVSAVLNTLYGLYCAPPAPPATGRKIKRSGTSIKGE
jgi:ArsR family transcriptional regulator, virulence genes transcriptional regulator